MGAVPLCLSGAPICVRLAWMKVLVVGAGGVGAAFAAIAQRRRAFERVVLADVAPERAQAVADRLGEHDRFSAERVDASDQKDRWSSSAAFSPMRQGARTDDGLPR